MATQRRATIDDLYAAPDNGKAEIVNGELIWIGPTGGKPGRAAGKVFASLNLYEEEHGGGYAIGDNVGFIVRLPNRDSFSPDAAWYTGDIEEDLSFLAGAPKFAVEVRSKDGYGPRAERAIREKIADYFAAGTQVVWDVDLLSENVIHVYRAIAPDDPVVFRRGEMADAEPAVPGWTFPVDVMFR